MIHTHYYNKLTQELLDRLVSTIRRGNFRGVAFKKEGISRHTGTYWLMKGKKQIQELEDGKRAHRDSTLYMELSRRFNMAEAEVECDIVDVLIESDPKIKMEYLKRRFNKRWGGTENKDTNSQLENEEINVEQLLQNKLESLPDRPVSEKTYH